MRRRKFLKSFAVLGGLRPFGPDFVKASGLLTPADATVSSDAALRPVGLKCEYETNPLGLDVLTPRLSWRLESRRRAQMQSAYQILVASCEQNVQTHRGDLWDSGKVSSDRSIQINYEGRSLQSCERCYWKVRVWDEAGNSSPYSDVATWEMGLLDEGAWQAKWISAKYLAAAHPPAVNLPPDDVLERHHRAPLLRRGFRLRESPARARVYVCGLGYYELYLNGAKVGDHVLDPAQTDYEKRAFYAAYDITDSVKAGDNAVGVMLGSGWFNQDEVWKTGRYSVPGGTDYGVPRLLLQLRLEYRDGTVATIVTDENWKTAPGPILKNNVYGGEFYDARLEMPGWSRPGFGDQAWENAGAVAAPTERLQAQNLPPIKAVKTLPAASVSKVRPGVFVYDFGQNIAGWAKLRMTAPRGTKIVLRFAESVFADGMIDPASTGVFATRLVQTDTYIAKGGGEEMWEPRFTYHAFRYVEMTGFPGAPARENLTGVVVHTAVSEVGDFECSDALLNRIHRTALWTEVGNLHGVPTDCPGREKCGWLGDAQVSAEMTIYNFDMARFWAKYLEDIHTSEVDGLPTMVAPGKRERERATPDWGTAVVQIPWYAYLYYGDKRILEQHYESMNRWMNHLQGMAREYIVSRGLGDWCPPGSVRPTETPVRSTSTAYFYLDAQIMSAVAKILGRVDDARNFQALAGKIRQAFIETFFNAASMSYGSQTADSLALRLGLAPAKDEVQVAAALARDVVEKHHGHFSTGITGSRCLYWALAEYGHGDVALEILRQKTYPSIEYLFSLGATTFWETWGEPEIDKSEGPRSRNHAMQGGFDAWFYQGLAGICPDPDQPGFKHTILRPQIPSGLRHVRAEYNSVHGKIASEWRIEDGSFHWRVAIPANSRATVYLPCDDTGPITEGGRPVNELRELSLRSKIPGWAVFEISSGEYHFASRLAQPWKPPLSGDFPRPWW
jgi:alpha-L-rhamnosidase